MTPAPRPPAPVPPSASARDGGASRPACLLLAAYLACTAALLARAAVATFVGTALDGSGSGAHAGAAGRLLAAHTVLLGVAVWGAVRERTGERRGPAATLAAWLPLVAVPLCYAELPTVAAALATMAGMGGSGTHAVMHDARVIAWERALFDSWLGWSPAVVLARRWPSRALSELLHAGYLSYYARIYLPPFLLWRAGRRRAFAAAVLTVLATFVACYAAFLTFPVQGPWYTWPHAVAVPDGPVRALVQRLLLAGSSRGTAFPSSHVAVSVAHTLVLARVAPRMAGVAGVATALLAAGAMYGGLHYGVDVVAGGLLGALVGAAAGCWFPTATDPGRARSRPPHTKRREG